MMVSAFNKNEYNIAPTDDFEYLRLPFLMRNGFDEIKEIHFQFTEHEIELLNKLCRHKKQSVEILCLATYYVLIYKYLAIENISIWMPLSRENVVRNEVNYHEHSEDLIIIKQKLNSDMRFKDVLIMVNRYVLDVINNKIDDEKCCILDSENDRIYKYDCGICFDNVVALELMDELKHKVQSFVLMNILWEIDSLECILYYSDNISDFIAESISKVYGHILSQTCRHPNIQLKDISIQQCHITGIFDSVCWDEDKIIGDYLYHSINKYANKPALIFEDKIITYEELGIFSNRIAHRICHELGGGIMSNNIVPVLIDRSLCSVLAVLGVILAGCAYVPIDVKSPVSRIEYILHDCNADMLLYADELPNIDFSGNIINVQNIIFDDKIPSTEIISEGVSPLSLAYVIYTSGSTGLPKGVLIQHKNVIDLFTHMGDMSFDVEDVWTLYHKLSFDFSVWELFGCLFYGGTLLILSNDDVLDIKRLNDLIVRYGVSIVNQTPNAFFNLMIMMIEQADNSIYDIRYIILGGDKLYPKMLEPFRNKYPAIRIINMYGITETTVHTTYRFIDNSDIAFNCSSIGRQLPTKKVYLCDKDGFIVLPGMQGELVVGGAGVALGYLNQVDMTTKHFREYNGITYFLSKDYAIQVSKNNYVYLNRTDGQLKIRGHRIEVSEIEQVLHRYPDVEKVIVRARESENRGDIQKTLIAYLITEQKIEFQDLMSFVKQHLPYYMIPNKYYTIEHCPLTDNGKIDVEYLEEHSYDIIHHNECDIPANDIELALIDMWQGLLGVEGISPNDNFFELGGHSLKAIILTGNIKKTFGVNVLFTDIFEYPTVSKLADYINKCERSLFGSIDKAERKEYYALSSSQKRFFVLSHQKGVGLSYNMPRFFIIETPFDYQRICNAVKLLMNRHESLRTGFDIIDNNVVQIIHEECSIDILHTSSTLADVEKIIQTFVRAFNLNEPPLFRVGVIDIIDVQQQMILFDIHHIIADNISLEILASDFFKLYAGDKINPLPIQYKDYAEWHNNMLQTYFVIKQKEFWLNRFKYGVPVLNFPLDFKRLHYQTFNGDSIQFEVDAAVSKNIINICKVLNITQHAFMFAIYSLLLYYYTKQEDMVIGSWVSGRNTSEIDQVIGLFANILPIRIAIDNQQNFKEFALYIHNSLLDYYKNQFYPYDALVEDLYEIIDHSMNPLFQTMLIFGNYTNNKSAEQLKIKKYPYTSKMSTLDFKLDIANDDDRFYCLLEYNTDLFSQESMKNLCETFINLIDRVISDNECRINEYNIINKNREKELFEKNQNNINDNIQLRFISNRCFYSAEEYLCNKAAQIGIYINVHVDIIKHNSLNNVLSARDSKMGLSIIIIDINQCLNDTDMSDMRLLYEWLYSVDQEYSQKIIMAIMPLNSKYQQMIEEIAFIRKKAKDIAKRHGNIIYIDYDEIIRLYNVECIYIGNAKRTVDDYSNSFLDIVYTTLAKAIHNMIKQQYRYILFECDDFIWAGSSNDKAAEKQIIRHQYMGIQNYLLAKVNEGFKLLILTKSSKDNVENLISNNTSMIIHIDDIMDIHQNFSEHELDISYYYEKYGIGSNEIIYVSSKDGYYKNYVQKTYPNTLICEQNSSNYFEQFARIMDRYIGVNKKYVRVVISANFSVEPIEKYVKWWSEQYDIDVNIMYSPYNQIFQQLLESTSIFNNNNGIGLIILSLEEWVYYLTDSVDAGDVVEKYTNEFIDIILRKKFTYPTFLMLLPITREHESEKFNTLIKRCRNRIIEECTNINNFFVENCYYIFNDSPIDTDTEQKGHMPFTSEYYAFIGQQAAKLIYSWYNHIYKLIIVDCDNTLWKGICGEVGSHNIEIDDNYAFFQMRLKQAKQSGYLLALNSKNDESDVWDVFENNEHMILRKEDFVTTRINWNSKSSNNASIMEELNIFEESIIFIDDDPNECIDVLNNNHGVMVYKFPHNSKYVISFLSSLWPICRSNITIEDKMRTELYNNEKKREVLKNNIGDKTTFLMHLNLKVVMNIITNYEYERIAQLTQRTNQFNSSSIRKSVDDIHSDLQYGKIIWSVNVSDDFGEYGMTNVIIAIDNGDYLYVEVFLQSCRVLGRDVEYAVLFGLKKYCEKNEIKYIILLYIETQKNQMFKDFLEMAGFETISSNGQKMEFKIDVEKINSVPEYIDFAYIDNTVDTNILYRYNENTTGCILNDIIYHKLDDSVYIDEAWFDYVKRYKSDIMKEYLPLIFNTPLKSKEIVDSMLVKTNSEIYQPPTSPMEIELANIWRSVLNVDRVGITDDFFKLGGNSILAIKLQVELEKQGMLRSDIIDVYKYRTINNMLKQQKSIQYTDENMIDGTHLIDNIIPFNHIFYKTCFHNSLLPVIRYLGKDLKGLFSNDLVEYKIYDDSMFPVRTEYKERMDLKSILKSEGIHINAISQIPIDRLIFRIKNAIELNHPIIIWVDSFFEPIRDDAFLKSHIPHTLLVYGYNDNKQTVTILEHINYGSMYYHERTLKYEDLIRSYQGYQDMYYDEGIYTYFEFQRGGDLSKNESQRFLFEYNEETVSLHINNVLTLDKGIDSIIEGVISGISIEDGIENINQVINAKRYESYRNRIIYGQESDFFLHMESLAKEWSKSRSILIKYHLEEEFSELKKSIVIEQFEKLRETEHKYVSFLKSYLSDASAELQN